MQETTVNVSESRTSEQTPAPAVKTKKKRSFWDGFYSFIALGGLILIVVVVGVLAIVIGMALK
jgi:hypothetical protein